MLLKKFENVGFPSYSADTCCFIKVFPFDFMSQEKQKLGSEFEVET